MCERRKRSGFWRSIWCESVGDCGGSVITSDIFECLLISAISHHHQVLLLLCLSDQIFCSCDNSIHRSASIQLISTLTTHEKHTFNGLLWNYYHRLSVLVNKNHHFRVWCEPFKQPNFGRVVFVLSVKRSRETRPISNVREYYQHSIDTFPLVVCVSFIHSWKISTTEMKTNRNCLFECILRVRISQFLVRRKATNQFVQTTNDNDDDQLR